MAWPAQVLYLKAAEDDGVLSSLLDSFRISEMLQGAADRTTGQAGTVTVEPMASGHSRRLGAQPIPYIVVQLKRRAAECTAFPLPI